MKRLATIFLFAILAPLVVGQTASVGGSEPATVVASGTLSPTPAVVSPAHGNGAIPAAAQPRPFKLNIGLEGTGERGEVSIALQILIIMTLLSVAPSIVLLMTSFTRIVIVLGFVRTALGTP